jgi:hypothetical protein
MVLKIIATLILVISALIASFDFQFFTNRVYLTNKLLFISVTLPFGEAQKPIMAKKTDRKI